MSTSAHLFDLVDLVDDLLTLRACPGCPTAQAAREAFFTEDVGTRLAGMLGPFVVTAALVALFVQKLNARGRRAAETKDRRTE